MSGIQAWQPSPSAMEGVLMRVPKPEPLGLGLMLVAALWFAVLFDPHWLLASRGVGFLLKVPVLLFGCLLLTLMVEVPGSPAKSRRWQWYAPFAMYLMVGVIAMPFAPNIGIAKDAIQQELLWWTLIVGTVAFVDSARRAELLVTVYGLQFLWWALWGARTGQVVWHSTLSNFDGFGAFNVGGLGICYFLALATEKRWLRWLMYATAALCALGVVASFARGAFLATVLVFFAIWLRSPHKGRTFAAGVAAALIVVIAANVLHDGAFWAEIMSSFHEGTTEGTGEDRMILWSAAWRVFLERPIFGAGPSNWGALASEIIRPGELKGVYANPGSLYDMSLHSLYMTTLSELGILGSFALLWILVDFWKRVRALRTEAAARRWKELGGRLKLRPISYGMEAAMVAFLANASLYSMMGLHWFYTMLAVNLVLHSVVVRNRPRMPKQRYRRGVSSSPAPQRLVRRRT